MEPAAAGYRQDAALAYLTVLRTKTARRIQKDNLKLTRSNLDLAAARESVGYALRDEVFRWEAEVANGQKLWSPPRLKNGRLKWT